jgi:uncharacterized protein (TIGR03382 family)
MQLVRIAVVVVACALARPARAHFLLQAPTSNFQEGSAGDPQKSAPCGQADPGITAVPTNAVTTVAPGAQLRITIQEAIFHPGHYRVAFAADMNSLPLDPMTDTACSFATVESPTVLPVIADNMLVHTSAFTSPQSFDVTIPSNPGCTTCTLQVIEFMLNHGGNCYYHHCATLNVVAGGGGDDAGVGSGGSGGGGNDAGTGGGAGHHSGCNASGGAGSPAAFALLAAIAWRRRRR